MDLWYEGIKSQNIIFGFTSTGVFPEYLGHEAEKKTNVPTISSYHQHFISDEIHNYEFDMEFLLLVIVLIII
jgi:hypothetical protein